MELFLKQREQRRREGLLFPPIEKRVLFRGVRAKKCIERERGEEKLCAPSLVVCSIILLLGKRTREVPRRVGTQTSGEGSNQY